MNIVLYCDFILSVGQLGLHMWPSLMCLVGYDFVPGFHILSGTKADKLINILKKQRQQTKQEKSHKKKNHSVFMFGKSIKVKNNFAETFVHFAALFL